MNGWLLTAFLKTPLWTSRSHLMLLNLSVASMARTLLAGFLFTGPSAMLSRWQFGETGCTVFAFTNHFIGVYQVEALTHLCIERYVQVKYVKYGWLMTRGQYVLFVGLCWMFASLYSLAPLMGLGQYACDVTGIACSLDLVLSPDPWKKFSTLSLALLSGLKPLLVMSAMLWWTWDLEKRHYIGEQHQQQREVTHLALLVTAWTLCCWLVPALLSGGLLLAQVVGGAVVQPWPLLAVVAPLCAEIAPAAPALACLCGGGRMRDAMMRAAGRSRHRKDS